MESTTDKDERIYPCEKCGVMRSKAEGGTTFTVCDDCWVAPEEAATPIIENIEKLPAGRTWAIRDWMDGSLVASITTDDLKSLVSQLSTANDELERLRSALEQRNARARLADALDTLYKQERNVEISSFWDGGWQVRRGDVTNGFSAPERFDTVDEMATDLAASALEGK